MMGCLRNTPEQLLSTLVREVRILLQRLPGVGGEATG